MKSKLAICVYGNFEILNSKNIDQYDVFACTNKNIDLPNIKSIRIAPELDELDMFEVAIFLKRDYEIQHSFKYETVFVCTPDRLIALPDMEAKNNSLIAEVSTLKSPYLAKIDYSLLLTDSITADIISHFNQYTEDPNLVSIFESLGPRDKYNSLFYHFLCSLYINYENCDMFKRPT